MAASPGSTNEICTKYRRLKANPPKFNKKQSPDPARASKPHPQHGKQWISVKFQASRRVDFRAESGELTIRWLASRGLRAHSRRSGIRGVTFRCLPATLAQATTDDPSVRAHRRREAVVAGRADRPFDVAGVGLAAASVVSGDERRRGVDRASSPDFRIRGSGGSRESRPVREWSGFAPSGRNGRWWRPRRRGIPPAALPAPSPCRNQC